MGIIILDTIVLDSGIEIANTYGSFHFNTLNLAKIKLNTGVPPIQTSLPGSPEYIVNGTLLIWKDKDARTRNLPFIFRYNLVKTLTYDQLDSNLYYILYQEIKKRFINTEDDL